MVAAVTIAKFAMISATTPPGIPPLLQFLSLLQQHPQHQCLVNINNTNLVLEDQKILSR